MDIREKIALIRKGEMDEIRVTKPHRLNAAQKTGRRRAGRKLAHKRQKRSSVMKRIRSLKKNLRSGKRSLQTLRKHRFGKRH